MKWITTRVIALVIPALVAGAGALHAQTPVSDWGAVGTRLGVTGWTLGIDDSTPAGDVSISGDVTSTNWTGIRGGFEETMTATLDEAVIVRGQIELVGGQAAHWNAIRWGLFRHDDIGTLHNANSDSAQWGYTQYAGTDSAAFVANEAQAHGYLITNRIGSEGPVGGNGGSGDVHVVNGGSWISTFSGGTAPLGAPFNQAPRNAVMPEGTYEFAMSAQPQEDGTTEFRWYIVHENQTYWHAGIHTDTTAQKTEFNGFAFSYRPEVEGITQINLTGVTVETGDPIEIPEAPFTAFYVEDWGAIGTRLGVTGWTLENDSTTLVGDATISGDVTSTNWTAIRGGFGNSVKATDTEAIIVTGEIELVGGTAAHWNALRWGLFQHEDAGTLHYQYTDSAQWGYTQYPNTDSSAFVSNEAQAYGYLITNRIGSEGPVGGNGGSGDVHVVNGGSWISTFSGGTVPLGAPFNQAPRNATMPAGRYEFAMSAHQNSEGMTEFRWYIVHEDDSYWHAGVHTDTTDAKTEFNGFLFSYRPEVAGINQINLVEVFVDQGAPIDIPQAPFTAFYVEDWGAIGTRLDVTGWTLDNDSTTLVGDATISGDVTSTNWTAIRGGFGDPIMATPTEAVIVSGQIELVGGNAAHWNAIRWGLFNHEDEGVLNYQYTDSARWGYTQYPGTDSSAFVSNEAQAYGYLITNRIGSEGPVGGNGGSGDVHVVNGGSWISTFSGGTAPLGAPYNQAPRNATMPEGLYDFAMSAHPKGDGTTEFRWYIVHEDETYWHAGIHTDTTGEKTTFDGFLFSYRPEVAGINQINLYEVFVDRGAPITIPAAPFSDFYVDAWGFVGGMFGDAEGDSLWTLTPGEFVGDVAIGGEPPTGPALLAGAFASTATLENEALVITGEITFEGGGFEDHRSFRFGVFDMALGGLDSTDAVGYVWNGEADGTGYLFLPPNAAGDPPTWTSGDPGTIGAVVDGPWYNPEGPGAFSLKNAIATGTPTAGTYEFAISIQPMDDGGNEIRVKLVKDDESYSYQAIAFDEGDPVTNTFNAIGFGVSNASTTQLSIEALFVEMGSPIEVVTDVEDVASDLPKTFGLEQNYPNPFNPATTIKFSLPEASEVRLEVFNMVGQKVATLVSQQMQPGYHEVNFDARHLASGTYFYRIQAADFVRTLKMVLIK